MTEQPGQEGVTLEELEEVLEVLRPDGPWLLVAISSRTGAIEARTFSARHEAARWAFAQNGVDREKNLYWAVGRTVGVIHRKPARMEIESLSYVWVDVDPQGDASTFDGERRMIHRRLQEMDPCLLVDSGGGYQALWRIEQTTELDLVEQLCRQVVDLAQGDPACAEASRILRLPATVNWPPKRKQDKGRKPAMAMLVSSVNRDAYPLEDLVRRWGAEVAEVPDSSKTPSKPVMEGPVSRVQAGSERQEGGPDSLPEGVPPDPGLEVKLRSALCFLSSEGYQDWLELGLALRRSELPLEVSKGIWIEWARRAPNFDLDENLRKWERIVQASDARPGERKISVSSIYHDARKRGWMEPNPDPVIPDSGPLPASVIGSMWGPIGKGLLSQRPPVRAFLLRHPTRGGEPCAPGEGDGFLPLGKAGIVSSAGGAGKTHLLIQLALCVVTRRPFLGHFHIGHTAPRRFAMLLAEEDQAEVHRRLFQAAAAMELNSDERALVERNLVALPLEGQSVPLLRLDEDGLAVATTELVALRDRLESTAGDEGYGGLVIDPLARVSGVDAEGKNTLATAFVQAIESLCHVPGNPTVLVSAHSSKFSRRLGEADSRGVTALTDGFRWHATLKVKGRLLSLAVEKNNYGPPMQGPLNLHRGEKGWLSVESLAQQATRERLELEVDENYDQDVDRLVAVLQESNGSPIPSKTSLAAMAQMRKARAMTVIDLAVHQGRILKDRDGYKLAPTPTENGDETQTETENRPWEEGE